MMAHELRPGDVFNHGGLACRVLSVDYATRKSLTGALELDPGPDQKLMMITVTRGPSHPNGEILLAGWMPVQVLERKM